MPFSCECGCIYAVCDGCECESHGLLDHIPLAKLKDTIGQPRPPAWNEILVNSLANQRAHDLWHQQEDRLSHERKCPWVACFHEESDESGEAKEGVVYYHNAITHETVWEQVPYRTL